MVFTQHITSLAKLRQPTGQTQDNFNFSPSLLKGAMDKKADGDICAHFLCFSIVFSEILNVRSLNTPETAAFTIPQWEVYIG